MSATGRTNDELPRLPPVPRVTAPDSTGESARIRADLGPSDRTGAIIRRMAWSEYVEPELLRLRFAGRAVIVTRVALAACAVGVVVAAMALRADTDGRNARTVTVDRLGAIGLVIAGVATIAGWYWTDRATRDVHRLEARLPSRRRCVTAWAAPLVCGIAISLVVLRLDRTEPVDVRPFVAGAVLAAALWRPYALVRRILKSLIRVDSDLVIVSGYVLDMAVFGLLWARIASLPDVLTPADAGVVGVLLGLAAVAALAAIGNVGAWFVIVRDVDRAVAHRRVAMRTRHEHRQLRLAGIDPLDPKVRLALLMIRQAEARGAPAASAAVASETPALRVAERPGWTTPDVGAGHRDPNVPTPAASDARAEAPGAASTVGGGASAAAPVDRRAAGAGDRVDVRPTAPILDRLERKLRPADDAAVAAPALRGGRDDVSHQLRGDAPADGGGPVLDRLARALGRLGGDAADDGRSVPERLDRLSSRLSGDGPSDAGGSILDRLERFGITPSGDVVPERGRPGTEPLAAAPLMIPRVHGLEAVRYLLVLAIVVCAGAAAWFVGQSVDVGQVADGAIVPTALDRLELARLVAVRALAVALALVPLWCAVAARWAARVGLPVGGAARCALLTVVAAGFAGGGVVADPATDVMLVAIVACLGAALWALPVMIDIERRAGRGTTVPLLVPLALAAAVATASLGRLSRPVAPTDSLEAMSFVGGLLALVAAIAAVVTAVATGDAVEAIRLAPAASERATSRDEA